MGMSGVSWRELHAGARGRIDGRADFGVRKPSCDEKGSLMTCPGHVTLQVHAPISIAPYRVAVRGRCARACVTHRDDGEDTRLCTAAWTDCSTFQNAVDDRSTFPNSAAFRGYEMGGGSRPHHFLREARLHRARPPDRRTRTGSRNSNRCSRPAALSGMGHVAVTP